MPDIPPNLNIRRARENDLPEMARIHLNAYPGLQMTLEETIAHMRNNPRLSLEDYWVCERKGRLAGLFALYKFTMHRVGKTLPAGGIGSVAVAPEARRARMASYMMQRAIEIMDQNLIPLSILYPFKHSFYRKLGWGLIGRIRSYRFAPGSLPHFEEREAVQPVTTTEEQEAVMSCYNRYARRSNGLIQRGDLQWIERIFKNALCYGYFDPASGRVEGYITFRYKPYPKEQQFLATDLEVWDFVYNNRNALHGLLGFLAAQSDQVKMVVFPDQGMLPLEHLLKEPKIPVGKHDWLMGAETARLGSNLMGRIVKLKQALMTAGKFGNASGAVTFNIRDDLNTSNATPLTVEIEDGKLEIKNGNSASLRLTADIATFSSIYWGALSVREAALLGLVEVEGKGNAGFLNQMFEVTPPMCLDHF